MKLSRRELFANVLLTAPGVENVRVRLLCLSSPPSAGWSYMRPSCNEIVGQKSDLRQSTPPAFLLKYADFELNIIDIVRYHIIDLP